MCFPTSWSELKKLAKDVSSCAAAAGGGGEMGEGAGVDVGWTGDDSGTKGCYAVTGK